MDDKDIKRTASHYFRSDSASVFDDISNSSQIDQPSLSSGETDNTRGITAPNKSPLFLASPPPFSYANTTTSTIQNISLEDPILQDFAEPSHIMAEDRSYDAWIPSASTKEALLNLTSSPGTFKVDRNLLVTPSIAFKDDFGDPIRNLVQNFFGEEAASQRKTLMTTSVTQDNRGLRQLIANGCYHAAVNLTTQLLTVYGQGEKRAGQISKHTAHSVQLWFTRIALLIKLRRFSLAEVECEPLGDLNSPDLYFEFYPELCGGRKGSMVPFSFRLLVGELPQYLGKHAQALDRLSKILATCNKIIENLKSDLTEDGSEVLKKATKHDSLKVWKARRVKVLYSLTRCAVSLKDFRLASTLLQSLLKEEEAPTSGLFAALGRLCLYLGDIRSAQEAFKRHLEHSPTGGSYDPVQGLLHSAFLACAQNDYKEAVQILEQAHKISPENPLVINNLGVCMMFMGQIREAIHVVETSIYAHPEKLIHEALILNLATMYELESSAAHKKKLDLLSLVSKYKGDGFNIAALKLQG